MSDAGANMTDTELTDYMTHDNYDMTNNIPLYTVHNIADLPPVDPLIVTVAFCSGYLYLPMNVAGKDMLSLIDTGSSRSIMSHQLYKMISDIHKQKLTETDVRLRSAEGRNLTVYGTLPSVPILLDNDIKLTTDLIVAAIDENVIIGNSFLSDNSVKMDFKSLILTINNTDIPLIQLNSNGTATGDISCLIDTEIQGEQSIVARVSGENLEFPNTFRYSPNKALFQEVDPILINLDSEFVKVDINVGNMPVTIPKGEMLGVVTTVTKDELSTDLKTWEWSEDRRVEQIYKELELEQNELLNDSQRKLIKENIVRKYNKCFSLSYLEMGMCDFWAHRIRLKDDSVIINRTRRLPQHQFKEMRKLISDLTTMGLLKRSWSKHRSPAQIVRKKDGSARLVCDYRQLNSQVIPEAVPMPDIWQCRSGFKDAKYFSILDLKDSFWQVPIVDKQSQELTTIWIHGLGSFSWQCVPQGYINASFCLQHVIDKTLFEIKGDVCQAYLDDIATGSKTIEGMIDNLAKILEKLEEGKLKIKSTKCKFFRKEIKFLGCVLSESGLQINKLKVQDLLQMSEPRTKRQLQSLLGLANYFQEFCPKYSQITKPLNMCLRGNDFNFTPEAKIAFEKLKSVSFTSNPFSSTEVASTLPSLTVITVFSVKVTSFQSS